MQAKIEIPLMTKIRTFGKLQAIDPRITKETVKLKGKARIWTNLRQKDKKCKIHSRVFSFKKEIIPLIPSKMTTKVKDLKKTNHLFSILKLIEALPKAKDPIHSKLPATMITKQVQNSRRLILSNRLKRKILDQDLRKNMILSVSKIHSKKLKCLMT